MASALTVLLLGCWLAGRSGVSGPNAPSETSPLPNSFHMRGGGCHWKDARLAWWGQGLGELPRNGQPHSGGPTDGGEGGSYSCQYSTKWDSPFWSEPSDPVQLVVAGGSEPSAAPDLTRRIMAGVSAVAAGLLLLLLAFLCYRSTQGRKGPDPRQSRRESNAAATVYTLIGEGKELDVLPQEPDPDYAEVDTQVL
ncbi:unnamed protein product [Caretta caretta]